MVNDAIILCKGNLDSCTGKTARGLIRYSPQYNIVGVLDSTNAGRDAGAVVDGKRRDIPVFETMTSALESLDRKPDYLIIGVATIGGKLPPEFRPIIRTALASGISVISGLHEFLGDDPELAQLASENDAEIQDIWREPPLHQLHGYRNLAIEIDAIKIPVLGTDSAVGKRTTAIELVQSLDARGIKAEFIATGQTGLLQGAKYGVALDSIQGDYMVGNWRLPSLMLTKKRTRRSSLSRVRAASPTPPTCAAHGR